MQTLNESVRQVVSSHHCTATDPDEEGKVGIYDEDGEWLLSVPADISPSLLYLIFQYGARRYTDGRRVGEAEAKTAMRRVLGLRG